MSEREVDDYLAGLDDEHSATLEQVRRTIASVVPEAEQGLGYGVPVFRLGGKPIAGFSAAKQHVSYLPHSGAILDGWSADQLLGFTATKGAVKMPLGQPLPEELVRRLIELRRAEAGV